MCCLVFGALGKCNERDDDIYDPHARSLYSALLYSFDISSEFQTLRLLCLGVQKGVNKTSSMVTLC